MISTIRKQVKDLNRDIVVYRVDLGELNKIKKTYSNIRYINLRKQFLEIMVSKLTIERDNLVR